MKTKIKIAFILSILPFAIIWHFVASDFGYNTLIVDFVGIGLFLIQLASAFYFWRKLWKLIKSN